MSATTTIDLSTVTATRIRTFRTSPAFELTLLVAGEPVATVSNDGRGGSHRWAPPGRSSDYRAAREWQRRLNETVMALGLPLVSEYEAADCIASGLSDGARHGAEAADWWREAMADLI